MFHFDVFKPRRTTKYVEVIEKNMHKESQRHNQSRKDTKMPEETWR